GPIYFRHFRPRSHSTKYSICDRQTLATSSFDRVLELIAIEKQKSNNQRMHQSGGSPFGGS
ncbi:hypothetical protein, partial [Rosistilla oblonga]|uniref:hypothetical protein n=1 Tax=Rosistilla oblonga TaxID=2527990 RepID=UPI003A96DB1C